MNYLTGFAVPTILLFAGVFGKKLVRGRGWQPNDFYLGVELTLGALTSGLLHVFDLTKKIRAGNPTPALVNNMVGTGLFVVITFMVFLYVLTVHQDWEHVATSKSKNWRLIGGCNFLGLFLMASFLLWVKGID